MVCCGQPFIDTQTPPPPPIGACCLRTRYVCEDIGGVSTWVLDVATTACVDNNECGAGTSCTELEFVSEIINGCVCAAPLPALPVPTCDPYCVETTTTTTTTTTSTTSTTTTTTTTTTSTTSTTAAPLCDPWVVSEGPTAAGGEVTFAGPGAAGCDGFIDIGVVCGVDPEGVVFDVFFDGFFQFSTGCETTDVLATFVPQGVISINIKSTGGCLLGPDACTWTVTGGGP